MRRLLATAVLLAACAGDPAVDDKDTVPEVGDTDAPPTPGPADLRLRHLTYGELDHAVADLLGVDVQPSAQLPEELQGEGYPTDVSVHTPSELLVEAFFRAVDEAVDTLGADEGLSIARVQAEDLDVAWTDTFDVVQGRPSTWTLVAEDPLDAAVELVVPNPGTYTLELQVSRLLHPEASGGSEAPRVTVRVDDAVVWDDTITATDHDHAPLSIPLTLGQRSFTLGLSFQPLPLQSLMMDDLSIRSPDQRANALATAAVTCAADPDIADACLLTVLEPIAARAWRRPIDAERRGALLSIVRGTLRDGTVADGLRVGLAAILSSPEFWWVWEGDDGDQEGTTYRLGSFEVATRLALLVWQSVPDAALLDCAAQGGLQGSTEGGCSVTAQLERLMADPRATRLATGFGLSWLGVSELDGLTVDPDVFPTYDADLAASMMEEARLLLETTFLEDRPLGRVLDAPTTFVDRRLAAHYGLPAPTYAGLSEVEVPASRRGVLRQAAFLRATSDANRVNHVRRGSFVLHRFVCDPTESAPPGIPSIDDAADPDAALIAHTSNPACKSCHQKLDPHGMALSSYDALGRYDAGRYVVSPFDLAFDDADGLIAALVDQDVAVRCMARHLAAWALDRTVPEVDATFAEQLDGLAYEGLTLRQLLTTIVTSDVFLTRPAEVAP